MQWRSKVTIHSVKMWKTVFVVLTVVLALRLYTPVPDDIPDKWHVRQLYAVKTVVDWVLNVQTLFNGKGYYENHRVMMDSGAAYIQETRDDSNIRVTQTTFDGVEVLLYEPIKRSSKLLPALVYFHGGGFVILSTKTYHPLTLQFAEELGIVVVSVEYRLAPEHPFPAGYQDGLTATKWFLSHLKDYQVDPTRVAVAGDSAGGRLTAALMIELREETALPKVKTQGLIYPSLQSLDVNGPSRQLYKKNWGNGGILNPEDSAVFTSLYLLGKIDKDFIQAMLSDQIVPLEFRKTDNRYSKYISHDLIPDHMKGPSFYKKPTPPRYVDDTFWKKYKEVLLDFRYSPLLAHDLRNLPKAYVMTCEHDTLRDDGVMYYERLQKANVEAELINYQGGYHGMITVPFGNYSVARTAIADFLDYLRENL